MNDIRAYAALDLREQAPDIRTPVVALHGEHDWSIPPELGKRTTELVAGPSRFVPIKDAGHFPHTETTEAFHRAFQEALDGLRAELESVRQP